MTWHEGVLVVVCIALAVFAWRMAFEVDELEGAQREALRSGLGTVLDSIAENLEHRDGEEREDWYELTADDAVGLPASYVTLVREMLPSATGWTNTRIASSLGARDAARATTLLHSRALIRPCLVHGLNEWFLTPRGKALAQVITDAPA